MNFSKGIKNTTFIDLDINYLVKDIGGRAICLSKVRSLRDKLVGANFFHALGVGKISSLITEEIISSISSDGGETEFSDILSYNNGEGQEVVWRIFDREGGGFLMIGEKALGRHNPKTTPNLINKKQGVICEKREG